MPCVRWGGVHPVRNRLDDALSVLQEALAIAGNIDAPSSESRLHETFARLCELRGDQTGALDHFKKFHELQARVVNDANERALRNMLLRFQLERTKIESEEVRRANTDLTRALEKEGSLNRALEEMNNEKSELIGIVAHDLRDPVASIKMLSGLSQDRSLPPEDAPQFVSAIQSASERALELITSLLSMNAVETGKVHYTFAMLAPYAVLDSVLAQFAKPAAEKAIVINRTLPPPGATISTDKNALREIAENLISNAVKYTPRGKNISIVEHRSTLPCSAFPCATKVPGFYPRIMRGCSGNFRG